MHPWLARCGAGTNARLKLAEAQAGGIKYMGVYQRAVEYERGSLVTFDGSMWCANERTRDELGKTGAWTLAVKRGRDGRERPR